MLAAVSAAERTAAALAPASSSVGAPPPANKSGKVVPGSPALVPSEPLVVSTPLGFLFEKSAEVMDLVESGGLEVVEVDSSAPRMEKFSSEKRFSMNVGDAMKLAKTVVKRRRNKKKGDAGSSSPLAKRARLSPPSPGRGSGEGLLSDGEDHGGGEDPADMFNSSRNKPGSFLSTAQDHSLLVSGVDDKRLLPLLKEIFPGCAAVTEVDEGPSPTVSAAKSAPGAGRAGSPATTASETLLVQVFRLARSLVAALVAEAMVQTGAAPHAGDQTLVHGCVLVQKIAKQLQSRLDSVDSTTNATSEASSVLSAMLNRALQHPTSLVHGAETHRDRLRALVLLGLMDLELQSTPFRVRKSLIGDLTDEDAASDITPPDGGAKCVVNEAAVHLKWCWAVGWGGGRNIVAGAADRPLTFFVAAIAGRGGGTPLCLADLRPLHAQVVSCRPEKLRKNFCLSDRQVSVSVSEQSKHCFLCLQSLSSARLTRASAAGDPAALSEEGGETTRPAAPREPTTKRKNWTSRLNLDIPKDLICHPSFRQTAHNETVDAVIELVGAQSYRKQAAVRDFENRERGHTE